MIFLTNAVYFLGKCMTDNKGFSIYNESGSKHVLNLPWRLGVKAYDKHGRIFNVRLKF